MMKFSIITITYNAASVLGRTTDSVLCQTYPCVEHIIVDGASTDDTLSLANDYSQRSYASGNGHEIRILSEPDNGIYDAMNKGLQMATGDYVCFMNAGDAYPNADVLQNIADCTKNDSPGELPAVIFGNTDIVDDHGDFIGRRRLQPPDDLTWRSFRHGMLVCHQAFYARTDMAKKIPYDTRYRYSADVDWCIRIMKQAEAQHLPLLNLHATVANYAQQGETTRHHKESLKERFQIMARHYGKTSTILMHLWFAARAVWKRS